MDLLGFDARIGGTTTDGTQARASQKRPTNLAAKLHHNLNQKRGRLEVILNALSSSTSFSVVAVNP